MIRFPERTLKLEAILMFALVFTGTLTWRVYACCETPPSLQSYHSCSHPPDVDCGSGMDCHHCLCNAFVREAIPATDRIIHAACSYGGQIKDFNHYSDATGWDNANLTGACLTDAIASEHIEYASSADEESWCLVHGSICYYSLCSAYCTWP